MAQNDYHPLDYWKKMYFESISEFLSLSEKYVIIPTSEEHTETNILTGIIYSEPDLGIFCIKNSIMFRCQYTLEAITERINFILYFNKPVRSNAVKIRQQITTDLKAMLAYACNNSLKFPPKVYASYENGLCCFESNINLHVEYHHPNPNVLWQEILKKIADHPEPRFVDERLEFDATNSELLLKMTHKKTAIETVVSFTNELKLNNAMLVDIYLNLDLNLYPLMLFLKHILAVHNLHGEDKISTYHLFWLITYYFQRKKLLPTVKNIRGVSVSKHYIANKWNCSVPLLEHISFTSNNRINETPASLFLGFVTFYKNFNFLRYVISPYFGCTIPLEDFDTWIIPMDVLDAEKHKDVVGKISFIKSAVNYQDPTILDSNLFGTVSTKMINSFKYLCKYLYTYYYGTIYQRNNFHIDFPIDKPVRTPVNLIYYASIILTDKNLPTMHDLNSSIILAVRKLMENMLKFTLMRTTSKIEKKLHRSITVKYFDYIIDSETCEIATSSIIDQIRESAPGTIINFDLPRLKGEQYKMFIVCEIYEDKVVLLFEGTAPLIEFINMFGSKLLQYIIRHTNKNKTEI